MQLCKATLIVLIIGLAFTLVNAQGTDDAKVRLQGIHRQPASIEKDSALTYEYNFLAEAYSGQQDSLASLYVDSLRRLNAVSSWKKTEGLYLRAQGKYHDRRGEFQQALEKYTQAIESLEKNGDQSEFVAYAYILKAFVLNNNGLAEDCLMTLEQIRPLAEKLSNKNYLAWIIDCYGDQYFYSSFGHQDFKKALEYYLQVEQLLPQVKNLMIKADNAHGLAGCYIRLGDLENAFKYRNLALDIAKANHLHSVIFAVYGDMADVYEEKGNFDEAIKYRMLGLDYARQTHWI
jgi:tetratricopeptide (TPR) repeat protein